ncbi:MAG: hypothetical protein IT203_04915 [Fimbriimonadaceae bacterium]|nr:hypothetical protein [Fimbriimonadaceae bacterium]
MKKYLFSLVLLIVATGSIYGNGETVPASYNVQNAKCASDVACNADNGCSWITHVYDYWFHPGECQTTGSTTEEPCTMRWRLCNHHSDYADMNCSGFVEEQMHYQYGCP